MSMSISASLKFVTAALVVGGAGTAGWFLARPSAPPQERRIEMTARQYAYDPPTLEINQGDSVRLRITSTDVVHGFYLEGYDIDATIIPQSPYIELSRPSRPKLPPQKVEEIAFMADKTGKFRYRCSHTCGTLHPFMNGELVVAPNRLFGAGLGSLLGLALAGGTIAFWNGKRRLRASVAEGGRA